MEFIKRSPEPEHLATNKERWTKPWIDYYRKVRDQEGNLIRPNKPSDNHWTDDRIRKILIGDFKNNCGYCGSSRPTPQDVENKGRTPKGHVDHYRAKAIHPEYTYDWLNYIWACESCNVEKAEFDDPESPILNPCKEDDCIQLSFIIETGGYCLSCDNDEYIMRFQHTDELTMLNSEEVIVKRRNRVKNLKHFFFYTDELLKNIPEGFPTCLINDGILRIKDNMEDREFYFLMQKNYHELCNTHPNVAKVLGDFVI